jgi:hypothetical protein
MLYKIDLLKTTLLNGFFKAMGVAKKPDECVNAV